MPASAAVVLLMGEYVSDRELASRITGQDAGSPAPGLDLTDMTLEEIERVIVTRVVETTGGNKSEAARRLGITRKTLVSKMQG